MLLSPTLKPTEGAPTSMEALTELLKNDTMVKVAGELQSPMHYLRPVPVMGYYTSTALTLQASTSTACCAARS
jgi:hypothetical protein